MIKIAIADDHPLILEGLKDSLSHEDNIHLSATASSGSELLEVLKSSSVDIVLTDINMPGLSGFDLITKAGEVQPNCRFIVLSVHTEKAVIQKAYRLGAYGYLLKSSAPDEILNAIETVFAGKKYFSDDVLSITMGVDENIDNDLAKKSLLSEREIEIIEHIVDGLSNLEIGKKLFISKRTVDAHRNNILQKLDVKNTAQLVRFALKNGLCD